MLALLIALLLALFGASSASSTKAPPRTTVMKAAPPPFTIGGRTPPVVAGAVRLREGDVVHFASGVRVLRVSRLECPSDVHRITLHGATWRVPDLPTGYYGVETGSRGQLVRVESHSAPCP
jgi:hypothetical protein